MGIIEEIVRETINEVLLGNLSDGHMHNSNRLDEMARVGFMGNNYDVIVWTDDPGYIPHVHVRDTSTKGKNFDTCIMLGDNKYFLHNNHMDKMNSKMCKMFNDFMHQPSRNVHYRNNYEHAVNLWNDNNSESYIQIQEDENGDVIVPDYTHIEE